MSKKSSPHQSRRGRRKKHNAQRCKVRLRPRMGRIRRAIEAKHQGDKDTLREVIATKDKEIAVLNDTIVNKDRGRSLMSHLKSWWANRKAA